jgi:hypothetical protein
MEHAFRDVSCRNKYKKVAKAYISAYDNNIPEPEQAIGQTG